MLDSSKFDKWWKTAGFQLAPESACEEAFALGFGHTVSEIMNNLYLQRALAIVGNSPKHHRGLDWARAEIRRKECCRIFVIGEQVAKTEREELEAKIQSLLFFGSTTSQ